MGLFSVFKKKKDVDLPPLPSNINNKGQPKNSESNDTKLDGSINSPAQLPNPNSQSLGSNQSNDNKNITSTNIPLNKNIDSNMPLPPSPNDSLSPVKNDLDKSKDDNKIKDSNNMNNDHMQETKKQDNIPEPPKPIALTSANNEQMPNFKELLDKHDVSKMSQNNIPSGISSHESQNQLSQSQMQNDSSDVNDSSNINTNNSSDELDSLNIDDLDLSIPEIDGENDSDAVDSLNKNLDETTTNELSVDEDASSLFKIDKKGNENKQEHTEPKYNITYDNVRPDYEGFVFMELDNARNIMEEVSNSHSIIDNTNLNYDFLFEKQKKTISKLRDNIEDMESRLIKIDKKLF